MKSAFKNISLRIGDEETLISFTVSVQDDTERFTRGGIERSPSVRSFFILFLPKTRQIILSTLSLYFLWRYHRCFA